MTVEDRLSNVTVTVDDNLCFTYPAVVTQRVTDFTCAGGVMTGTRVRLTRVTPPGPTNEFNYLINLCEFQVYSEYLIA